MKILSGRLVLMCISFTILILVSGNISHARIDPRTVELLLLFDEGKGDVAKDSSGNGRDGAITGAKWVDGKFGKALEFDGVDDKVVTTGYFGVGGKDPRTTVFWWKGSDAIRHSWVKWGINSTGQKYYIRGDNTAAGKITLRVEVEGGQSYGSTNVCDGEWHHLAVVFPEGSDSVKDHLLYVDGVLEQNPAGTDINMDTNNKTTEIHIGSPVPGVAQHVFAKGIMDEIAIFNVALTEDGIRSIMNNGLAGVLSVEPIGKLTTTWGSIKAEYYQ